MNKIMIYSFLKAVYEHLYLNVKYTYVKLGGASFISRCVSLFV